MLTSSNGKLNPSSKEDNYFNAYSTTSLDVTDKSLRSNLVPVSSHGVPLSPYSAGATLINLVLATGPFSYPYSYIKCSPLAGTILMGFIFFLAYMTAGFMVETLSISCAMRYNTDRSLYNYTIYPSLPGESPSIKRKRDEADEGVKHNPYYIREKVEISKMSDDHTHPIVKYFIFFVISVYMYGAMIFKYVSGAQSLSEGISFTFTGNKDKYDNDFHFYYICISVFSVVCLIFSLGNIENSKVLQIVTMFLRFFTTFLMIIGSVISLFTHGLTMKVDDVVPDLSHASNLFANTVFIFVVHHSISGIVKPVRPQTSVYNTLFYSFAIGGSILCVESVLAALAFSRIDNTNCDTFPCEIQSLYNENFTSLPFIGQVCNFYPALNVAALPILTITLRNNLFVLVGIETKKETRVMKAIWSIGLSIPVIAVSCIFRDAQLIMTYQLVLKILKTKLIFRFY